MNIELKHLETEGVNLNTLNIDSVSVLEKLKLINNEDKTIAYAVEKQLPQIAEFIEKTVVKLKNGGRLIYVGSGASGRLGYLDAAEIPPTYGVPFEMIQGTISGGISTLVKAIEGAEDDKEAGRNDLIAKNLSEKDVVLAVASSGRTPYAIGALEYAREIGAETGSLSCTTNAELSKIANTAIEVITGPEVINGSTRMKAATSQKMVLNMISTSVMIELGKVYKNFMVDMKPKNGKLIARAKRLIQLSCECSEEESHRLFEKSDGNIKAAIIMHNLHVTAEEARKMLDEENGIVKNVLIKHSDL